MSTFCKKTVFPVFLVMGLIILAGPVQASIVMFDMDTVFYPVDPTDPLKPDSQGSSLSATFDDESISGGVKLTLTANLMYSHNVKDWFFNFDPDLDPEGLTFTPLGGTAPNDDISLGTDAFGADGGGYYDIKILFPDIEVMPGGDVFDGNEYFDFLITHPEPIDAVSFNYQGAPHGGYGIWYGAGHIQNLNDDPEQSTWIGDQDGPPIVPIPGIIWLLGSGLVVFAGVRKKFRK
jgi:hypothetical protein